MKYNYNITHVIIDESVIDVFKNYIQYLKEDKEAGGIIVGKIYDELIEITNCSTPNKYDKRSRFNFVRAHKPAQEFINKKFLKSQGTKIYLGEWHTHPEDIPTPSHTDITNFKKTIKMNQLNSNIHLMIIVGRTALYMGIYYNKTFIEKRILKVN